MKIQQSRLMHAPAINLHLQYSTWLISRRKYWFYPLLLSAGTKHARYYIGREELMSLTIAHAQGIGPTNSAADIKILLSGDVPQSIRSTLSGMYLKEQPTTN